MKFLQCLGDPAASCDSKSRELDVPLLDANGKKRGCVFCDVTVDKGFNVVWEDEELIAFCTDVLPGAQGLLCIYWSSLALILVSRDVDVQRKSTGPIEKGHEG